MASEFAARPFYLIMVKTVAKWKEQKLFVLRDEQRIRTHVGGSGSYNRRENTLLYSKGLSRPS